MVACRAGPRATTPQRMKFRPVTLLALPLLATAAFVGCSSADSDSHETSEQCEEIGSLCHEPGETNAQAQACHEFGHDGDPEVCADMYDDCIALCEELIGAGGAGGAGGGGGAGGEGGATH
jgi:hypothetical protein